ncbi:MAG: hypothetical protein EBR09_11480 [Proteobacteria bacterium]|nr:hypothetical protein [Pseudomonadota bacterium]
MRRMRTRVFQTRLGTASKADSQEENQLRERVDRPPVGGTHFVPRVRIAARGTLKSKKRDRQDAGLSFLQHSVSSIGVAFLILLWP